MGNKNLIIEISPRDFDPNDSIEDIKEYKIRRASRGILKKGNLIALINISKHGYHKLPGGGIEKDETPEEAFKREILEETGCTSSIKDFGGITIEYRRESKTFQLSYVFFGEVVEETGKVAFEESEIEEGSQLEWIPITDVKKLMSSENPLEFDGNYIHKRDKEIFNFYKGYLSK
ncbi:MAG: hypothetical protein COU27_03115 [Candidatus Levybacteria bacterium CG10_big_fil_rev_8_21_14_0_10_36_7]|nr:MAG: hypothetical protein COU27_03115 [Candidatus Levybacteria bacterium CG10_big_fil_rev_8_21_14_0_10_36_7]